MGFLSTVRHKGHEPDVGVTASSLPDEEEDDPRQTRYLELCMAACAAGGRFCRASIVLNLSASPTTAVTAWAAEDGFPK